MSRSVLPSPLIRLAIAFAAIALFALLATMPAAMVAADQQLAATMRASVPRPLLQVAFAITQLGNFATLVAVGMIVALWLAIRRQGSDLLLWLAVTAGNGLLNRTLKHTFERVRPLHDHGLVIEPAYSFPSGHASGALAVYGLLTLLVSRQVPQRAQRPLLMGGMVLILLIGASRVILHVHFLSDVIAGYASATALLLVFLTISERLRQRPVC